MESVPCIKLLPGSLEQRASLPARVRPELQDAPHEYPGALLCLQSMPRPGAIAGKEGAGIRLWNEEEVIRFRRMVQGVEIDEFHGVLWCDEKGDEIRSP